MRNLDNFIQAPESPKSWNLTGYFCPKINLSKKYILSAKILYTEYLTFNYLCEKSPSYLCHYITFHNTAPLYFFLAQTLHKFYKSSPSKCKFSDFLLLRLKFTKFLISFFKQKVSFSSKFGSLFNVMRDNSSVLFLLKLYMLLIKVHSGQHPSKPLWKNLCPLHRTIPP